MVQEKQFREDLFFRIFSMSIHLPALRDRKNDIPVFATAHLNQPLILHIVIKIVLT